MKTICAILKGGIFLSLLFASPMASATAADLKISADTDWRNKPPTDGDFQFGTLIIEEGATLTVPAGTVIRCKGSFSNSGTILAPGGDVHVYAAAGIDNRGVIRATGIQLLGGNQGDVTNSGTLRATRTIGGKAVGGAVDVTGQDIIMRSTAVVDASGAGGGGTVRIGGGLHGADKSII